MPERKVSYRVRLVAEGDEVKLADGDRVVSAEFISQPLPRTPFIQVIVEHEEP